MIPQISNRPPKATSAEVDIGTNDSKYVTPLSLANSKLALAPTDLKISTASKGGVFNGGFELGTKDTAVTADGVIGTNSGWYFDEIADQASAELDTAITRSGIASLKLEAVNTTGTGIVYSTTGVTLPILSMEAIPLKVSTIYRLNLWAKTNLVGASGVFADVIQYDSAAVVGTTVTTSKLTTTNDWTLLTITFTSDNDTVFGRIALHNDVAGTVSQAWFDDITLEEIVTDTTFTGKVAEKIRPVLQAVTSTDNIDQSYIVNENAGAMSLGYTGYRYLGQKFTPTKKYCTGFWIYKRSEAGTPTTSVIVSIVADATGEPEGAVLASKTYTAAAWIALSVGYNFIDLPCILTAATQYWIKFDAGGASGTDYYNLGRSDASPATTLYYSADAATWADAGREINFKQCYAKKSEGFTLISNGIKTELKADKDGLLTGAVIDLDNGKYRYKNSGANLALTEANDVFQASAGGVSATPIISGWDLLSDGYASGIGATERYLTWKVNTLLPIKHLKLTTYIYWTSSSIQISPDNVTWTTLVTATANAYRNDVLETDLLNGLSVFYIRLYKAAAANNYCYLGYLNIDADLDTSSVPLGLLYPIGTNQFTETVKLPSVATRIYYRLNKFANDGVVVPHLEFTNASAVNIFQVPLKLNNSQETNPAIAIIKASTTNGQAVGTGSDEGANYILNDGEYMTLSTAVAELSVVYLVGKGTTAFTNITMNYLRLSSNAESSDSTQDPSHQANFIVGVRQQGLTDRVKDLGDEIADIKLNKPVHTDMFAKEWYIPSLPSLATTGLGRPMPMTKTGKINYVNVTLNGIVSSPSIYFDINKNFTSIFETATRPLITNGTFASTASIYTNTFVRGDIFTVDYDFGGNSKDAIVTIVGE